MSEIEDHVVADRAYETDGEDEVSTLTQQQLLDQDSQISGDITSLQSSNSILQPLRYIHH